MADFIHKLFSRLLDRFRVRRRNRQFAVCDMALHALKPRVFFARVHLVVQRSAVVRSRRDVTHIARPDSDFFRRRVERVDRRRVVTGRAFHIGVTRKLVPEGGGRIAPPPREHHHPIFDLHRRGDARVEIGFRFRRAQFMTGRAIGRRRRNSRIRRMTCKTGRVRGGRGLESSLFEPERIAQFIGRLHGVFVRAVALRLVSLMTNRAARLGRAAFRARGEKERAARRARNFVLADDIDVFVVRKEDLKIRSGGGFALRRLIENLARVRKRMARSARRLWVRMTNRADRRTRALEKLLAMTAQTGFVARIFRDVGKRVRFSDGFPVSGRKFMTRVALQFMRAVRKCGIARRARRRHAWCAPRRQPFFLRAGGKAAVCEIGVKRAERQQANERRRQREADS